MGRRRVPVSVRCTPGPQRVSVRGPRPPHACGFPHPSPPLRSPEEASGQFCRGQRDCFKGVVSPKRAIFVLGSGGNTLAPDGRPRNVPSESSRRAPPADPRRVPNPCARGWRGSVRAGARGPVPVPTPTAVPGASPGAAPARPPPPAPAPPRSWASARPPHNGRAPPRGAGIRPRAAPPPPPAVPGQAFAPQRRLRCAPRTG